MTAPGPSWADPAGGTEPVGYAGPPSTAPYSTPYAPAYPQPYGAGPYGAPGWSPAAPPYWPVAYGPPVPARPRRPGQVVAAAVLAFVQAALVACSSAYVLLLVSTFGFLAAVPGSSAGDVDDASRLLTEVTLVAAGQLLSAVALVVAGVVVLNRRSRAVRTTLLAVFAVQLALAVYWVVRLASLGEFLGSRPTGGLVVAVLFYAACPAVGFGLLLVGAVRRWADGADGDDATGAPQGR